MGGYDISVTDTANPAITQVVTLTVDPAATTTTTSAPLIPEYPYGLTLLAILLVIGYGVVRRRINY